MCSASTWRTATTRNTRKSSSGHAKHVGMARSRWPSLPTCRQASRRARSVNDDRGRSSSLTSDHVLVLHRGKVSGTAAMAEFADFADFERYFLDRVK